MAVIVWKVIYVCARGLVTGWLLASWVCLFRQCETAGQPETWIVTGSSEKFSVGTPRCGVRCGSWKRRYLKALRTAQRAVPTR